MKINPLLKKLKGYQKAPKERFRLFTSAHKLTPQEFILYEFAIAITDWDRHHTTFGTFAGSNKQIADLLGWKSDATVLRLKKALIKKKLFSPSDDERLVVNGFAKWELRKSEKNQPIPANNQYTSDKTQELPEKNQRNYSQNSEQSLVSYKGDISSFKDTDTEEISDEELDEIGELLDNRYNENFSKKDNSGYSKENF